MKRKNKKVAIGIDPGTKTGLAFYDGNEDALTLVQTVKIHEAMEFVKEQSLIHEDELLVRVEDARKRKWFGKGTPEQINAKKQGAGSVKRDCAIWEDFLTDIDAVHQFVSPGAANTKVSSAYFKKLTGYTKRTSEHARDAAMLVYKII